jgi:hypothetical protein
MTKKKIKPLSLLLIAILMGTNSYAQSINFNFTDGSNSSYDVAELRKITFDADVMNLYLMDGSLYTWNVSTIGDYDYGDSSLNAGALLNSLNTWDLIIFPNPVSNSLKIQYKLPKEDKISIALYDVLGKLILEKKFGEQLPGSHSDVIDLTNIPKGNYGLRIVGQNQSITKNVIKQ